MAEFKLPTETVELPSKGLLYPKDSPLASGTIEMKYMTAKEEDILTNRNYIANGTVIDKLLEALIITPDVKYGDLLIGDKNALMVASRILSYGKDYTFQYGGREVTVDLAEVKNKVINEAPLQGGVNEFEFTLPKSNNVVTFKLLNHSDERAIEKELEGLQKINTEASHDVTTRLKHTILSVNGSREIADIRNFVDNYLLASDAREFRNYMKSITPDVDLVFYPNGGEEAVDLPIGIGFFWPE